jgi:hypothetical protein
MGSAQSGASAHQRAGRKKSNRKKSTLRMRRASATEKSVAIGLLLLIGGAFAVYRVLDFHARYTLSLQAPIKLRLQWPLVVEPRTHSVEAGEAQLDQRRPLTAYQQYTCLKFGPACRIALAIQRAENPEGKCETYHYNSDGTLDWGYFQINTVHLKRPGLNLRDLLDCQANIDFAYQLYSEQQSFAAWSVYNNGAYRKYLRH